MSKSDKKSKGHLVSIPGENEVGNNRYTLLYGAAKKAAAAFKRGFYLEAITLTESLLATRLESRLGWVRSCQKRSEAIRFGTLGYLTGELLREDAKDAPDWDAFCCVIRDIAEWAAARNQALHEMAKLIEEDGHRFDQKYRQSRPTALNGFKLLLAYDDVDRKERRKAGKHTATDNMKGGTAFDRLIDIVESG